MCIVCLSLLFCRELERDCHRLRQEALELQSSMMHQQHQWRSKWLEKLSKSTMTDLLSRTDSATQVDLFSTLSSGLLVSETATQTALLSTHEEEGQDFRLKTDSLTQMDVDPSIRTTQISSLVSRESVSSIPEIESCVMSDSYQTLEVRCATFGNPQTQPLDEQRRRDSSRKRYHSESEISSIHQQMREALKEVKDMSNATSFEEMEEIRAASPPSSSSVTATLTHQPSTHSQTLSRGGRRGASNGSTLVGRQAGVRKTRHHPHQCMWKKLLKTSQQRLFTLTKQVRKDWCRDKDGGREIERA